MSPRDFCWCCGGRIVSRGRIAHQAKCEAGHEIPEALICTRPQYRALEDLRAAANPPAETPAEIEAAFEDAAAARRVLPSGGSAVARPGDFLATIGATRAAREGGQRVYFSAAHVVSIHVDDADTGAWLRLTGGPAQHVQDEAEVLRRRVDLALAELARLGRGR